MNCPLCHAPDPRVCDSRPHPSHVHRRRECRRCGHRWSTWEIPAGDRFPSPRFKVWMGRVLDRLTALDRVLRELTVAPTTAPATRRASKRRRRPASPTR